MADEAAGGNRWLAVELVVSSLALAANSLLGPPGVSLMRGHAWAKKALYGIVGWLALVAIAVAAMVVSMRIHEDPAATPSHTIAYLAVASLLSALAVWLHGRLVASAPGPGSTARSRDDEGRSADW